jgi:23S rRNA-/tRNA-specific pseudouridylate synthase
VCVAKTRGACTSLSSHFMDRRACKRYRSIVIGQLEGEGIIDSPLADNKCAARTLPFFSCATSCFVRLGGVGGLSSLWTSLLS